MAVNSFNAQNPPVTTKGDVFTFSTIPTRLGVGANNTVLTADSSTATGLRWATPAAAGFVPNFTLLNTGGTTLSGATVSINVASRDCYFIIIQDASNANPSTFIDMRINNSNTNGDYQFVSFNGGWDFTANRQQLARQGNNQANVTHTMMFIMGGNSSGRKMYWGTTLGTGTGADSNMSFTGFYNRTDLITQFNFIANISGSTFDGGTVFIYGA